MSPGKRKHKSAVTSTGSVKVKLKDDLKVAWEKLSKAETAKKRGENKAISTSAKTKKVKKNDDIDKELKEDKVAMNINWAEQHDLTWRMLSTIQNSPIFLQAFSFDTGSENVNSGGKQTAELYRELARKVLVEDLDSTWAAADITKLGTTA
ncbi:hypothetical protein M422DRAFT_253987 [Sphaerobolus stellatus SS14]|uniref:Uncharacterized protein n=1 Tax=Sphaerobolus stellatus (strain SS14) TaxID=990650 RepID=A0A0C9VM65_SPHS4|nr:hypothetical protein M422DRAFT_253987 [Sphaerobolus stellatus SS14]